MKLKLIALTCILVFSGCSDAPKEVLLESIQSAEELKTKASAGGKYSGLLKVLSIPEDQIEFGDFRDWGMWKGSEYKGIEDLPSGYWVYVYPYWFIWEKQQIKI